jgi:hypothetical protein
VQRPEGVDHDSRLVGGGAPLRQAADGRLDSAGLRAVREARRMQGDRSDTHSGALASGVIPADVKHHLVGVHVVVVVRNRHRAVVEVERPRAERADHEVRALEGLVYRRRRMGPLHDRFEVGDVERVRVQAAVPADHVEGMMCVGKPGQAVAVAHQHGNVLTLGEQGPVRAAQIALGVRGVLQELSVLRQVAPRWPDVPACLDDQGVHGLTARNPAVNGSPGHDDVVTRGCVNRAVNRLEPGGACPEVDRLVARRIPVQLRWRFGRRERDPHVVVGQQHLPAEHEIAAGR